MASSDTASIKSSNKLFGSIRKLRRKNSSVTTTTTAGNGNSNATMTPDYPTYHGLDLNALSFLPENSTPRDRDRVGEDYPSPKQRYSPPRTGGPFSRNSLPGGKRSPLASGRDRSGSDLRRGEREDGNGNASPFAKPPTQEPPPAYTTSMVTGRPKSASVGLPSPLPLPLVAPATNGDVRTTPQAVTTTSPSADSTLPTDPSDTTESPYAFLTTFDTTLLIDDSGSMAGRSWREVSQALETIAPIVTQYDSDGIDIYFLNHKSSDPGNPAEGIAPTGYRGITRAQTVSEIFERVRPLGGTPTGQRVHAIVRPYLSLVERETALGREVKPLNLIVLTDGVPSDDIESVLLSAAKKLDRVDAPPYQVGVQFFQVGSEPGARQALRELDDGLEALVEGGVRDIVDTVTWTGGSGGSRGEAEVGLTGDGILKVVLGAVVRRLDRRRASGETRRS